MRGLAGHFLNRSRLKQVHKVKRKVAGQTGSLCNRFYYRSSREIHTLTEEISEGY